MLLGRTAEESSALRGTSDPAGQSRTEVWRKVRDPRNGSGRSQRFERFVRRKSCGSGGSRRSRAKSHGRPVGKPLRHPIWVSGRENDSRTTVCVSDLARGSSC